MGAEKQVLRFRATLVRNWALQRMREIRRTSDKVFEKLEDWVAVAFKAETDGIIEMENVVKQRIESEQKIQCELRIQCMDFFIDEKILNFLDKPPQKPPAVELVRPERFTIPQLRTINEELRMSKARPNFIEN